MRFTILSLVGFALLPLTTHAAEGTLEEIVVTAQRRVERLQDVPLAITALSGADLAEHGVRQAGDITASVPNMLLNSPYGPEAQPTFTLRGVTTQDYSQNQSSPIAMYVDEVYKPAGAWIKNIANRKYLAYGLNQNDPDTGALGFDYGLVGEPRTYGADLTFRF
jgi:outer membrane receptor protein involved in Fe transport